MDSCENTNNSSFTECKSLHIPSGFSILTCYSFDKSQNKQICYRGKDCMQKFSLHLGNIFVKLINYQQKPMILLTDSEIVLHDSQKVCSLCEKEFCTDKNNKKEYKRMCKVRDHCHFTGKYRGAAHSSCNLQYKVPRVIPVVFHNGSAYDNHFIIGQLAKDYNGYFSCIDENTEKYISFSITIIKEHDNKGKKKKPDDYTLRFIDSYRHMPSSLSKLADNLVEPGKNIPVHVLQETFPNTYKLSHNNDEKFKLLL